MAQFIVFDASGRILRYGDCPDDYIASQALDGETSIAYDGDVSDISHYWNGDAVVERPANPAVLEGMSIKQIPLGSVIVIDGISYHVDDGVADLSFAMPGTYTVNVFSFPCRDTSFEVIV